MSERVGRRLDLTGWSSEPFAAARLMRPDDSAEVADLLFDAFHGTVDDEGESRAGAFAEVERTLAGAYGEFNWWASVVVPHGRRVDGAALVVGADAPLLAFVATRPARQGHGLGRAMIGEAARLLAGQGYRELRLAVNPANRALALYTRMGFVELA